MILRTECMAILFQRHRLTRNRLLCSDSGLDLGKFTRDPIAIPAVVVEAVERLEGFVMAVFFDEMARRLGEEQHSYHEDQAGNSLEGQGKSIVGS